MTGAAALTFSSARRGDAMLRRGDLAAAAEAYSEALSLNPRDAEAMLGLSAILRRARNNDQARWLLEQAVRVRPVVHSGAVASGKAKILRPRCVDAAQYCAVRKSDGGYKTKFKGGHFSLQNLLPSGEFEMVIPHLLGGDPSPLFAAGPVDIVVNPIACADRGRASLEALQQFLAARPDLPVINRPEEVLKTRRCENYMRLRDVEGAIFPRTARLVLDRPTAALLDHLEQSGFALPLIVRATGRQTGRDCFRCDTRAEVEHALDALRPHGEAYVIAFIDCRRADGHFRKARAFFIDGKIYPVAWLTNDAWQIHSGDRYRVMSRSSTSQAEEQAYLENPEKACGPVAWAALGEIAQRLGLDFAGIDFTVAADGRLVIFETNAAMRHNFDHAGRFPYTRPHLETVSRAFTQMVTERSARPH